MQQAGDGRKIYLTNKWGKAGDADDVNEPRRVLEEMLKELGVQQLDLCESGGGAAPAGVCHTLPRAEH